jgi:hypothetical protein
MQYFSAAFNALNKETTFCLGTPDTGEPREFFSVRQ